MEWINSLISCFMILFSIIDILGNAPIIMGFKSKGNLIDTKKVIISSFVIFLSFLFLGQPMLKIIGVDIYSFSVAGSIVLFLIGLEMILGVDIHKVTKNAQTSIVPIAFPLIAGPGSLTTLISLRTTYNVNIILLSLILNMIVVYFVIDRCDFIAKTIGNNGLDILKKIFGIILLAFAVKIFGANAGQLFQQGL
ncbi:MarC family protein [Blattabacterium sp. (Cryptocercus kyebangensis)]|uniref:MarC family protein n=1 Tax=Blattabacterium sp. (Cryptocercus kyebangensis) TaxID=298656 RepID=UPI000D7C21A1|nr:MarC family protein [Blattabacterium sp. (Cryptocercus kyebangensis)]AWU43889.1 MarC family protein [Blattabacterium sp. (Cryptocercus kyebangensis)]